MVKIIQYLIHIRLQKLFRKVDVSVYFTVIIFWVVADYFLLGITAKYSYYILLTSLEALRYHRNRKDLDLLKFNARYKQILYIEYTIYSLPWTILLLISLQWIPFLIYQTLLLVYLYLPVYKTISFKYPFKLFDPFWVICFRKTKLFLSLILVFFFIYMGSDSENENLILFAFMIISLVICIPSFQRENIYFIKMSKTKEYLTQQIKINSYNSLFLLIPTAIFVSCFKRYELLLYIPFILFPLFLSMHFLTKP